MNQLRESPQASAIASFLSDRSDSRLPRRLARESVLPKHELYQAADYYGLSRQSNGTSMLVSSSDVTQDSDARRLPGLSRTSSVTTISSISPSIAIRCLDNQRLLGEGADGVLVVNTSRTIAILECPFNFLNCIHTFSDTGDWISHSILHFRNIAPPASNRCCFCDEAFVCSDGHQSWKMRMDHIELHHRLGQKLACARPDFGLFEYLWGKKIISDAEYRYLKGPREGPARRDQQPIMQQAYTQTNRNSRRDQERQSRR